MNAKWILLAALIAVASAGPLDLRKPGNPSGTTLTRTATFTNKDGVARLFITRSVNKGIRRVAGDRLLFEFRTIPVARVLFQYWKAEKTPGDTTVSTSAVNFRFAFWKAILFIDAGPCVVPSDTETCTNNCCGFDPHDTVVEEFILYGRQGVIGSGPAWYPIRLCPDPQNAMNPACSGYTPETGGTHQLNGTTQNGGFSMILHGNGQAFKTRGTGTREFTPDEIKLDVHITPANLFPATIGSNAAAKVALQVRFIARTAQFKLAYGNKTTAVAGTKADITLGDALDHDTYLGLDYTFNYLDLNGVMNVAPDPKVIVSPWFPLSQGQRAEDDEMQAGDFPHLFYVSFEKPVGSLTKIIWDPSFGLEGGDFGLVAGASSITLSGLAVLVAVMALLL